MWVEVPGHPGPDRTGIEEVLWDVPSRSGTTAGADLPGGLLPADCATTVAVGSPAHTRVRGLNFFFTLRYPFRAKRDRTRPERIRHIDKRHISVR